MSRKAQVKAHIGVIVRRLKAHNHLWRIWFDALGILRAIFGTQGQKDT